LPRNNPLSWTISATCKFGRFPTFKCFITGFRVKFPATIGLESICFSAKKATSSFRFSARKPFKIIENPNEEYIQKIVNILPYELDTHHLSPNEKTNFGATNNMKDWYSDTYINLVTETFFGKNVFLSEKIFKPLSNLQAFIVLGDYGTIAELKRLGFKTFEPFIDESYDLEIDSKIRIKKIEKEIEKLKNKSIEEIHEWYYNNRFLANKTINEYIGIKQFVLDDVNYQWSKLFNPTDYVIGLNLR
jgi:hypothetical protein